MQINIRVIKRQGLQIGQYSLKLQECNDHEADAETVKAVELVVLVIFVVFHFYLQIIDELNQSGVQL